MKFTKMHGCGNDYVYIDCTKEMIPDPAAAAIRLSDRHFGVGGDGMILICPSEVADFRMAMYNADGSEGKMCGNGIRCVAKYVYDKGLTDKTTVTVETLSGIKTLKLNIEAGKVASVRVDMGAPNCAASAIPVFGMGDFVVDREVTIAGIPWVITCVSMGNPHCVVWVENVDDVPLEHLGPQFENHRMFPDRVNTEFVQVVDDTHIRMRVWERGSGETLACGTGACAAVAAAYLCEYTDGKVEVELRGGKLDVEVADDGHIYMTGSATTVFEGEIEL